VLGALVAAFGLVVLAAALRLPGPTPADPVGPRGFPALLGLVLAGAGLGLALVPGPPPDDAAGRGRLAVRPLLAAIGLTAGYLAVLEPAGYLLATPPYLAGLLLAQDRKGRVSARAFALTVLGLPLVLYVFFAVAMRVPLPPGPLEPFLRGP
jgi:putative tricarboxylic transport membrane protein